jgi:aryl-alcohol dehydrogenase-like predicted oxidoreductase
VPIPGTKRTERLMENLGALSVNLTAAENAEIAAAVPSEAVAGTRYSEPQMKGIYL